MPVGVRRAFFIKTFCFCAPAIKVFVHALSARPLKNGWRGRESNIYADGIESIFFLLAVDGSWVLYGRGEHCSPAKILKETFLLSYFCVTKSTKSHLRGLSTLLKNTLRVHELVARAMRGKCVRQRTERKSAVSRYPQFQLYHACEHITRKSRADSCTHCMHAR